MSNINENIFQDFCKISQEVQKIQEKVVGSPVNPHARKLLHKELETIQDQLQRLRQGAEQTQVRALAQFETVENQVISLYREIEERFENYEITLISKGALHLGTSLENGKMFKISKQITKLQHNIVFLFEHRRPSLKNRKIVQLAVKLMDYAHDALSKKGETSKEQIKLIHLLKMLLQEAVTHIGMADDPVEQELAMELYEIVDLLYRKETNEGLLKLNLIRSKLKSAQKRRIDAAGKDPEQLMTILLEIADGDPCIEWELASKESVIHALYA
ncbi:MAG: hypothetical protein JSS30_07905 [Verrucomicrobia bacterium]|nr:hypothetical protein [Verrucomicrobiota bacterium]